jgi:beta-lactamase regulating signal transducer with metallopeptidase domain/peptidoglycan hydrolase CwlO-like protein
MTPTAAMQASTSILVQLTNPAARGLALGVAAGLGLAAFRVKTTSVRLFTWTAVLYAALAMPILGWMLPPLPVPTPAFLQHQTEQVASKGVAVSQPVAANPVPSAVGEAFTARNQVAPPSFQRSLFHWSSIHWSSIPWTAVAAGIYLAIALLLLVRFFVGFALSCRLMQASQMIDEPRVTLRVATSACAAGLSFVPQAAESEVISVPVTMGALRSTILLPATWREWDDAKLDAVVAHEMSHVARRDALTQRLSLLHRAIFWFSPLAWWLDRHLADLAEQASDEAALSCGADRKDYARTLLGFFEALQASPGRVWWQGVAMAKAGQAEERVERILAWKGAVAMNLKKSIAAVVLALVVPVVYLAASVRPANKTVASRGMELAQDQTPPTPPQAARASRAPRGSSGHGSSYAYGYDDEQRFVIASGKTDSLTMSGTTEDARHVEKLRKSIPGDFIWFERDEKSYIIRDQATIERARKFWAPQEDLGKKQEELGKQQEALGKQQEELGAKMEQVHVKVPDMTAELDKLKVELQQLNASATMEQVGQLQSEIGELQSKIGELQSQAGEQQSKLGEQMGALGERQGKLGAQQGELGRQQGELAREASRQMKLLLDDAIAKGTAQPEL